MSLLHSYFKTFTKKNAIFIDDILFTLFIFYMKDIMMQGTIHTNTSKLIVSVNDI